LKKHNSVQIRQQA
jgi:hypothetical protein